MRTAERAAGRAVSRGAERKLAALAAVAVAAALVMALFVTPPDAQQGQVFRLIYLHVPSAWLAYLSFAVVFVASIAYLRTKRTRWDRLAAASAEVGVVFTALTLIIGSIWAKPIWGTWWTWDPRLTTTAVLLLIYVGYLAVRRLSDDPMRRATWSAVVGVVGFVDVPIVHLSVVWWRSLHQVPAVAKFAPRMAPVMGWTLLLAVVAFTVLFAYLVVVRLRVGRLEARAVAEALSPRIGVRAAEAAAGADPMSEPEAPLGAGGTVEGVAAGG
jgi:heme exporter protein C